MASKPTILFVPGAWHKSAYYAPVIQSLNAIGYSTATAELASVGPKPGLETWTDDISNIQAVLSPLVDDGKNVIVAVHSYGSLPAGEALKPFLQRTREAEGKRGGVVHIVYICAFVLPAGVSLMGSLGGKDLSWFDVSASKREVDPIDPAEIFYNDLPAPEQEKQIKALETFSYRLFYQETTWAPYKEVKSSYVYCTKDNAIPLKIQQAMIKGSGAEFLETTVDAGHSPFLSKVEEVAKAIERAVESV